MCIIDYHSLGVGNKRIEISGGLHVSEKLAKILLEIYSYTST